MQNTICQAIQSHQVITFEYDGLERIVEPHQLGHRVNSTELELSGYQIGGMSKSGVLPSWRIFKLAGIQNLGTSGQSFNVRYGEGYKPAPNAIIANAICEV